MDDEGYLCIITLTCLSHKTQSLKERLKCLCAPLLPVFSALRSTLF